MESKLTGMQHDPALSHPRKGEFNRNARKAQVTQDAISGLIRAIGADKWIRAVASVAGEERALAAAEQYGIATNSYRDGREQLVHQVKQATVSYENAPPKDPNKRPAMEYLDYPGPMQVLASGHPIGSAAFQDACRQVDAEHPYDPEREALAVRPQIHQRSAVSTNPNAQFNADTMADVFSDPFATDQKIAEPAKPVSVPPMTVRHVSEV
jgi:hypothetical protein